VGQHLGWVVTILMGGCAVALLVFALLACELAKAPPH